MLFTMSDVEQVHRKEGGLELTPVTSPNEIFLSFKFLRSAKKVVGNAKDVWKEKSVKKLIINHRGEFKITSEG